MRMSRGLPVNEGGGRLAGQELGVAQDILQEQDVGLHPSDVELIQGSLHLLYCMQVGVSSAYDLQTQHLALTSCIFGP